MPPKKEAKLRSGDKSTDGPEDLIESNRKDDFIKSATAAPAFHHVHGWDGSRAQLGKNKTAFAYSWLSSPSHARTDEQIR